MGNNGEELENKISWYYLPQDYIRMMKFGMEIFCCQFIFSFSKLMLSFGKVLWVFFLSLELVVPRDNLCPSGLFELTRRPSGQKLSLGTTRAGPWDNKDSFPPLGQQSPTFGMKKKFYPPSGRQEKVGFFQKKEDFETFLGRKHWKNSNLALAGKGKAATLTKKVGKINSTFSVLYVQFLLLYYKKSWWIQFYINFYVSLCGHFFTPGFHSLLPIIILR